MDSFDDTPIRFKKILLTTDFSAVSARALPYAASVARRFQSMLYVAHIVPPEAYAHISLAERDAALAEMKREAEKQITGLLAGSEFAVIPHQVILDHGDVLPLLSGLVDELGIDLIVTGMHGRHGLPKLVSGSMAEEILELARLPVLGVGPEVITPPQAEAHLGRILCSTDFSPESRRAVRYAYALAKAYSARLFLLHVVDFEDAWKEPVATRLSADAFFRLELMVRGLPEREEGIETKHLVEFGPQEESILRVLEEQQIQLLVANVPGTEHPALSAHLPGPLAYNLVAHSRCPVLGVRGRAQIAGQKDVESHSAAD